jgi:protein-disulfide isomerase
MTIGDPAAAAQLVEYASLTCGHCAAFHADVFPRLKAEYVDTRRIGFTLREFPTQPVQIAVAMFQLARIGADADTYFERNGVLFREQGAILGTGSGAGVRDALIAIGARWGLSRDEVMAAMLDQSAATRIRASAEDGVERFGVAGTPSFVLTDQALPRSPMTATYGALSAALNTALGA